jgi:hypothetical protein
VEDRWLDLGVLDEGEWTVRTSFGDERFISFEVAPGSGEACADPRVGRGGTCERDCDCASERCVVDMSGGSCERVCGDLACGDEPDCLEGRCITEMSLSGVSRDEQVECHPSFGACTTDDDCSPTQRCVGESCVFGPHPAPFVECRSGRDCAAGWSCVVDEFDLESGECAVRCFTDHTPCPVGSCQALPGIGPAWTCSFLGD